MAAICLVVMERGGTEFPGLPEGEYIKVTKDNWWLLSFAINQQEYFANALAGTFYSGSGEREP